MIRIKLNHKYHSTDDHYYIVGEDWDSYYIGDKLDHDLLREFPKSIGEVYPIIEVQKSNFPEDDEQKLLDFFESIGIVV
jgi:hypothetical protein